jgi:uncharacterized membrane protein YcfT
MEGRPATNGGNNLSKGSARVEKSREIAERLAVRRRFYRGGFLILAVIVVSAASAVIGITPSAWVGMLAWVGSSLLGTAAILWWLYIARETSLYSDAGRELLGGK